MKKIEDYLHLYLGCDCYSYCEEGGEETIGKLNEIGVNKVGLVDDNCQYEFKPWEVKLILRPLLDMTNEEADYFGWLCMDSQYHLEDETRVTQAEIDTDLHKNDNGTMLDDDIEIYIEVTCRCYQGAVVIRKDGSITLYNEEDKADERIDGMAFKIQYLLSKHFDLFGLIPAGLAITKPIPNETT